MISSTKETFSSSPVALPATGPTNPILKKMIELLTDPNLTMDDVDVKLMEQFPELVEEGWKIGSTRQKIKRYPQLARTAAEARLLLWREVGISKIDVYRTYAEAMKAEKIAADGSTVPDHQIRIQANDRVAALMGENPTATGAKTNIQVNGDAAKILITTADGTPMPFPMRSETRPLDGGRVEDGN